MSNEATQPKTTMRQLLTRWAEVEPGRCLLVLAENLKPDKADCQEFYLVDSKRSQMVHSDVLDIDAESDDSLMRIQWAVQQAIVARGWYFEIKYDPNCADPKNPYDATVETSTIGDGWGFGNDGVTAPLLVAYLDALEANKKAGH